MAETKSHIGKSVYFSDELPATNDKAGFEALSWTEIAGFQGGAQFGFDNADIDAPDLKTGITRRQKGMGTGASSTLSFRKDSDDTTGQPGIKELADATGSVGSIKIGRGSGTDNALASGDPVQYAQGYFKSYTLMEASGTTHEGFTVVFQQNLPHIDDVEPT